MSNINERLDKLRILVQDEDFLEGKGLSNEVNIRIFCYDPAEEMRIKQFVKQITTDQSIKSHVVEYDLYIKAISHEERLMNLYVINKNM